MRRKNVRRTIRARHFFFSFFPCSADHERDWPPCKVVFFGLATNALNMRNNDNNIQRESGNSTKKNTRKKRHLQINNKEKIKRKKHVWLPGRLHIEGRLNKGPRLQRKHRAKTKQNKTNVIPEKKRHGICKRNARRIQVSATCG